MRATEGCDALMQEAIREAQEMEVKLVHEEEACNETMKALWEECKPCLKTTCVKYYSRTCSSGSGLVGRQVRMKLSTFFFFGFSFVVSYDCF